MIDYINILKQYKTPIYVYTFEKIENQIKVLRDTLPDGVKIYLSIKANPRKQIVSKMINIIDGVEVASGGEMDLALESGINNKNIIFIGPGKTVNELKRAIDNNIKLIVVESIEEINRINNICLKRRCKANIAIRINPKCINSSSRLKMGGVASQFGIDEEKVEQIIIGIDQYKGIEFKGVHFYFGSQILNADLLVNNMQYAISCCENMTKKTGVNFEFIDLGGGFGVPYYIGEKGIDLPVLKSKLNELFQKNRNKDFFKKTEFLVESGRFILANCGVYIVRVEYIKESREKKFVIVDGGFNHHSAAVGIGTILRGTFDIRCIEEKNTEMEKVTVVGPLCTPTDVLARDIFLPKLEEGDYLMVLNSGAYGVSASPINFLSHDEPVELLCDNESIYLIS